MKKIALILSVSIFLFACGNESSSDAGRDTSHATIAPGNTINNDTMNRINDTSSYERMPQKSADSLPQ